MESHAEDSSSHSQADDLTPRKLVYDNYFFESERMSHRTDWFLIFHAILLEAFFSINKCYTSSILTVGSLGVLLSFVWLANGLRYHRVQWQLGRFMESSEMGDIGKMHKKVFEVRGSINDNKWFGWAAFVPLFGVVVPFIFIVCWVVLICFRVPLSFCGVLLATVITVLVLILIAQVSRCLDQKFKNSTPKK